MAQKRSGNSGAGSSLLNLTKQYGRQLTKRLLEITALYDLSRACNFVVSLQDIVYQADKFLKKTLRVDDYCIMLLDETGKELRMLKTKSKIYSPEKGLSISLGEGVSGMAVSKRRSILVEDVKKDKRFLHYKGVKRGAGSFLSMPLKDPGGEILGVLNIHKAKPRSFSKQDLLFYGEAAIHIASVISKAQRPKTAELLSISDFLTGLFSRRYFLSELDRIVGSSERKHSKFALILIDVDHFKDVNDDFGHQQGDAVLSSLGSLINANIRKGDIAARYGGEEIIILVADGTLKDGLKLAEKLRSLTASTISAGTGAKKRQVTVSAGVAAFPAHGQAVTEIVAQADRALYLSKNRGRNQVNGPVESEQTIPNDRRGSPRFSVAIRRNYLKGGIGKIDLHRDGEKVPCMVFDVSSKGFKGLLSYKPVQGEALKCLVYSNEEPGEPIEFPISCRSAVQMDERFYAVGIEVLEDTAAWRRCVEKMGV